MKYRQIVDVVGWLVAILILILVLVFLVEFVTREPVIELKPGVVISHTYRDEHPVMIVRLDDDGLFELANWTETIGTRVEVPMVTGTESLLGILWRRDSNEK